MASWNNYAASFKGLIFLYSLHGHAGKALKFKTGTAIKEEVRVRVDGIPRVFLVLACTSQKNLIANAEGFSKAFGHFLADRSLSPLHC